MSAFLGSGTFVVIWIIGSIVATPLIMIAGWLFLKAFIRSSTIEFEEKVRQAQRDYENGIPE